MKSRLSRWLAFSAISPCTVYLKNKIMRIRANKYSGRLLILPVLHNLIPVFRIRSFFCEIIDKKSNYHHEQGTDPHRYKRIQIAEVISLGEMENYSSLMKNRKSSSIVKPDFLCLLVVVVVENLVAVLREQ